MKTCIDCAHWNPETPETAHCDVDHRSDIRHWWEAVTATYPMGSGIDCAKCPGFVQDPWNGQPPYISPDEVCPSCKSHNVSFAFGYLYCADCTHQWEPEPDIPHEKECDLCLGSGFVNDDDCPECHGAGTLEPVA